MTILIEGNLRMELPPTARGRKFDDKGLHGLTCMKAVDFIVELKDRLLFVEFKDPESPRAPALNTEDFIKKFRSGEMDTNLRNKYRDSWLYEWAQDRIKKPVFYYVLIGVRTLSDAELLARTDALKRQLPVAGPGGQPWKKPFVAGCAVMNLAAWNKHLSDFPVSRVGS